MTTLRLLKDNTNISSKLVMVFKSTQTLLMNYFKSTLNSNDLKLFTKISIPSQKWKDRGGGRGFGWVKSRTTRLICRARNILPADTENSTRSLIADMSQDILGLSSNQGISDKSMESSRKLENIGK